MNIQSFKKLPIGAIRYFDTIGSTNDEALAWAAQGAPNLSIVIADEQTAGLGQIKIGTTHNDRLPVFNEDLQTALQ